MNERPVPPRGIYKWRSAIILPVNQIGNVPGWIRFLTESVITIKRIKIVDVPWGTE